MCHATSANSRWRSFSFARTGKKWLKEPAESSIKHYEDTDSDFQSFTCVVSIDAALSLQPSDCLRPCLKEIYMLEWFKYEMPFMGSCV